MSLALATALRRCRARVKRPHLRILWTIRLEVQCVGGRSKRGNERTRDASGALLTASAEQTGVLGDHTTKALS